MSISNIFSVILFILLVVAFVYYSLRFLKWNREQTERHARIREEKEMARDAEMAAERAKFYDEKGHYHKAKKVVDPQAPRKK